MALNTQISNTGRNAALDGLRVLFNSGKLRIYSGTQPIDANTSLSGNILLAELTFGATAFAAASTGILTANAITSDTSADATGTASFYRCFQSDGVTVLLDGTVGTTGANMNLNSVSIVATATVAITSMTLTLPAAGL